MCTDFTDINKACPKGHYPLPSINKFIDFNSSHVVVSFLDTILGYHHILKDLEDIEKTAFIMDEGVFYYKIIPFRLKYAGVTYQMLVSSIFKDIVEMTVEVYVNDMVVKSQTLEDHPSDIKRVFNVLYKTGMKLNSKKCTFKVRAAKFFEYIVFERGIEANPNNIKII